MSLIPIIVYYRFKYSVGIKNTLLKSLRIRKRILKAIFRKTSYKDLVFAQIDFLLIFGDPNQSLILIIIYYMFKYSVGIKKTLLKSLRIRKRILKAIFRKTRYKDLVFARNDFLRIVGAPKEFLILILIY